MSSESITCAGLADRLSTLAADWNRYAAETDHPLWNDVAADVYRSCARRLEELAGDIRAQRLDLGASDAVSALAERIVDNLKTIGQSPAAADPVEQDRADWDREQRW